MNQNDESSKLTQTEKGLIRYEEVQNPTRCCWKKKSQHQIVFDLQELDNPELNICRENLIYLYNNCKRYDGAHSYTRNINVLGDKILKLSILVLSSLTTYFVASHDDVIFEEDLETDKILTLSTTLVSGLNAIFNFSDKAEIHKAIISDYVRLTNEISKYINTIDPKSKPDDVKKEYIKFFDRFNTGNDKTVSIGLMICAKRKYKII